MGVLNTYQRLDRVLPGLPFGNGSAGSVTISSDPNTRDTCTGTASSTTLTTGSATFANGDVLLIHQTKGTGAGQWEINRVASGGGSTSLTLQVALQYSYVSGAQAIKIPMYSTATISSYTPTAWNGSVGGIDIICGNISITGGGVSASSVGFRGGSGKVGNGTSDWGGQSGEGTTGGLVNQQSSANGNGAGGGANSGGSNRNGGGGGGCATSGQPGNLNGKGSGGPGAGGGSAGSSDLTSIVLGGGGGQQGFYGGWTPGPGGNGGGILILISKSITISSGITSNGGAGGGVNAGSGGGAGGSILLICRDASVGTYISATGGAGANPGADGSGGNGSDGRIAIHHSGTVTGTTNPTFTDISDPTLVERLGGSFLFNFI
jgi:hypothetical protein